MLHNTEPLLSADPMFTEWMALGRTSRRSLSRAAELLRALHIDEKLKRISIIGILGSKGKGTAAVYASATVASSDAKVVTVTGPGLVTDRDRIRVDGVVLDDTQYRRMLAAIVRARKLICPLTNETGYLAPSGLFILGAAVVATQVGAEVLVVEAGIGGLSDEISLLSLRGVILTEIFSEHASVLGPTIRDIARDKIGVIGSSTEFVVSANQSCQVELAIQDVVKRCDASILWIDQFPPPSPQLPLPTGYGRANALLGVSAGVQMIRALRGQAPARGSLMGVLETVKYPGRLSVHKFKGCRLVLDSAISRDGLVGSLTYAEQVLERPPDEVYLSMPANKDFTGCRRELENFRGRRVFVDMPESHLPFPERWDWPWDWIDLAELRQNLGLADCLLVGTATFTAAVLGMVGEDVSRIFSVPAGMCK